MAVSVVTSSQVRYRGLSMMASDGRQLVHAYLGVPYAQAPRRFAPPQPLVANGPIRDYDATSKATIKKKR